MDQNAESAMTIRLRTFARGFSLIEMVIVLAIMGFMLMYGIPTFRDMLANTTLRNWAESVNSGVQLARMEAIKQNRNIYFQAVTDLSSACGTPSTAAAPGTNVLANSANAWVVSTYSDITNTGVVTNACATAPSPATTAAHVVQSSLNENPVAVQMAANTPTVCFTPLGQLCSGSTSPIQYDVSSAVSGRICGINSGEARCLRIRVIESGKVTMCDPAVTATTDPRYCPP